jgi:hypothetical protein
MTETLIQKMQVSWWRRLIYAVLIKCIQKEIVEENQFLIH